MRRGRDFATGAVLALFIAAGLWFVVSDFNSVGQWYQENADQRSQEYARHAEDEIADCARLALAEQVECRSKAEESKRVSQHDEQDLAAQKITAWWTSVMGGAAVAGMLISVIGVFLVWGTFNETKRQVRLLTDQQRPDLLFTKVSLFSPNASGHQHVGSQPPKESMFQLVVRNHGAGTAIVDEVRYGYAVASEAPENVDYPFAADVPARLEISPQSMSNPSQKAILLTDDEVARLEGGEHLYFWARGVFLDYFNFRHTIGIGAYWTSGLHTGNMPPGATTVWVGDLALIQNRPDLNFRRIEEA